MNVTEPATFATDLLISGFSCFFLLRLVAKYRDTHSFTLLFWALGFGSLAISALTGAIFHGSGYWFDQSLRDVIWLVTLVTMITMSAFLLSAVTFSALEGRHKTVALSVILVKAVAVLIWILNDTRFVITICDYGFSMVCITVMATLRLRGSWKNPGRWILSAIALSIVGSVIQIMKIAPHPLFNHNDVFHLIQLAANWFFYRAALVSEDRSGRVKK
jgi:hypothetical protein